MGGPIVRTGTTPAFWENWDKAFGKGSGGGKKTSARKIAAKKPAKNTKSKPAGKAKKKKK
jgi:phage tail tape-measure protein